MKSVQIKLDKNRNALLDIAAIMGLERELNVNIFEFDLGKARFNEMITILWISLLHEDSSLTREDVVNLTKRFSDFPTVVRTVSDVFNLAFSIPGAEGNEVGTQESQAGEKGTN